MIAKLFKNGRSRAVRIPSAFGFGDCEEISIVQNPKTGDVILSRKPPNWDSFFAALGEVPVNFLNKKDRLQKTPDRDPFKGWHE